MLAGVRALRLRAPVVPGLEPRLLLHGAGAGVLSGSCAVLGLGFERRLRGAAAGVL